MIQGSAAAPSSASTPDAPKQAWGSDPSFECLTVAEGVL